ncbi:AAA family ATPase [Candidatus Babela massiliensis]|nr:AAA family ATPase [Candidatus Babela massiliensis]
MFICVNFSILSMRVQQETCSFQSKICQYKVLQQEDESSCGYHALYNGLTIAKSLKDPSFKDFLESNVDRNNLFGSLDSTWIKYIILQRIQLLAKYYITDYLFKNLKNIELISYASDNSYKLNLRNNWIKLIPLSHGLNDLEKARREFCNLIVNISNELANRLMHLEENSAIYNIKKEDIKDVLKSQYLSKKYNKVNKRLSNVEKYFIDLTDLSFEVIADGQIKNLDKDEFYIINWSSNVGKNFARFYKEEQNCSLLQAGHWLSSQEIESLIQLESGDSNLDQIEILCLERDLKQLFDQTSGEERLINIQRKFQDKNFSGAAIFLIYNSVHWISCVVTKDINESLKFIFADSLGCNYKSYKNANTLIKLLAGDDYELKHSNCTQNLESDTYQDEESSADSSESESADTFNINNYDFLPIELLLNKYNNEGFDRIRLEALIDNLKNGIGFDKSLFIYGPAKTGKFSLAYSIAKLTSLPFIIVEGYNLICLYDKEEANIDKDSNDINFKNLDQFLNKIRTKLPAICFIHLLDELLYKVDNKSSRKLIINFIFKKLTKYKRSNKVLFIISSHINYDQYPENINFKGLFDTNIINLDNPDYNKRFEIIGHNLNIYINKVREVMRLKEGIDVEKLNNIYVRDVDQEDLSTMAEGFSCYDIKEFISRAANVLIEGRKNDQKLSDNYVWWKSLDIKNRPVRTIARYAYYNGIFHRKVARFFLYNDYAKNFLDNLYTYWYIQSQEIETRKKLDKKFHSRSWASYVVQYCKDSDEINLVKDVFIYISDSKIGQAVIDGVCEEIKENSKYASKKYFDKIIPKEGLNLGCINCQNISKDESKKET